jgi:hypothetical protein
VTAKVERVLRYEGEQILSGDAPAPAIAGRLLLVGMTPRPEVEIAFNAWYDTEHVPAFARVPEVLRARRFRTSVGGPEYIALYHLASPGVVDTSEWKDASASTPMPQRASEQISNRCASCAEATYVQVDLAAAD